MTKGIRWSRPRRLWGYATPSGCQIENCEANHLEIAENFNQAQYTVSRLTTLDSVNRPERLWRKTMPRRTDGNWRM